MKDDNIIEAANRFSGSTDAQLVDNRGSTIKVELVIPISFKLITTIIVCLLTGRSLRLIKTLNAIPAPKPDIHV